MIDTNNELLHQVTCIAREYRDGILDDTLMVREMTAALSARASAGEGGESEPPKYHCQNGSGHVCLAASLRPGNVVCPHDECDIDTGVFEMPTAAPQPAQAGASGGWLLDGNLIYQLSDERRPQNTHEIKVTQWNGSRNMKDCDAAARELYRTIAAAPQPQEAPAQATDFARGLAEHDAKLYGTGFLVDGVRVAPDRIEIIAAAPQPQTPCSDYPNCPNLACPPGCAKPATPPAHGDGEGDKSEMADSDRLNSGKPVSPREIDKNQAHDLALSPKWPGESRHETALRYIRERENAPTSEVGKNAALALPAQGEGKNG